MFGTKPADDSFVPNNCVFIYMWWNCGGNKEGSKMIIHKDENDKASLIKENLKRAFEDKASEEVPPELLALLNALREQDENNGEK